MKYEWMEDYSWIEAFGYAGDPEAGCTNMQGGPVVENIPGAPEVSTAHFARGDVTEVFAHSEGENDERPWLCAGRLNDGRCFYLEAGCDYTGWD